MTQEWKIRLYKEADYKEIQVMCKVEGWTTFAEETERAMEAFNRSHVQVAEHEGKIIGYIRSISDQMITTYVCEILIHKDWRGKGVGRNLLDSCKETFPTTRIDLLGTASSHSYYESEGFRSFYGFRK
jgi:GNAT superfamily N-acetyltransferase